MLEHIDEISAEQGYQDVCLTTGKAHLTGLLDRSSQTDLRVSKMHTPKWLRKSTETVEYPNTTVEYETKLSGVAGTEQTVVRARIVAALVDTVVTLVVAFGIFMAMGLAALGLNKAALISDWLGGSVILSGVVVAPTLAAVVYGYATEQRYGRTLGKRLLGLVVVHEDGTPCTGRAAAVRNLLRPVDFVFGYTVGFVTMFATPRRQRLGDLVAGTTVVRAVHADVPVQSATRESREPRRVERIAD
jgi:uncharacterized RDD family membrane protein YckC